MNLSVKPKIGYPNAIALALALALAKRGALSAQRGALSAQRGALSAQRGVQPYGHENSLALLQSRSPTPYAKPREQPVFD